MAEGRVWIDADTMQEHQQLSPAAGVGEDASSPEPPREIWPGRFTTLFHTSDPQSRKRYVSAVWGHVDVIVCYGCLRNAIRHHEKSLSFSLTLENCEAR